MNFKEETIKAIGNRAIEEYRIRAIRCDTSEPDLIFEGKHNTIPWVDMDKRTNGLVSNYDNGYGSDNWGGWITFTDGTWISRVTYDGSEWWDNKSKPSLSNGILDSIGEFGSVDNVEIIRDER
jgi:hypothetical protein